MSVSLDPSGRTIIYRLNKSAYQRYPNTSFFQDGKLEFEGSGIGWSVFQRAEAGSTSLEVTGSSVPQQKLSNDSLFETTLSL